MSPLLALVVLMSVAGQVLVKAGADKTLPGTELARDAGLVVRFLSFVRRAANPFLLVGIALVGVVPLLYTRVLADAELSRVYGATGLGYPLVMLAGAVFFKERVNRRQILGAVLIVAGFLVWSAA